MFEKSFDISVVLPIYNGGKLFMNAIYSIEESKLPFKNIFISFNGESIADYEIFSKIKSQNQLKYSYTIFQTKKNLDAIEHGNFYLKQLEKVLNKNSIIFMLSHDDRIIPPNKEEFISLLNNNELNSTIFFPSYHCCIHDNYQDVIKIIEKNEYLSTEDFFFRSLKENISTNISGMILPFHAWLYAHKIVNNAKSRGARSEHIICISPNINTICFHNKLKMLIGERPDSEGKLLTYRDHRVATFNYVFSFLKNRHLKSFSLTPRYLYYLAKHWIGHLLYK